MARTLPNDFVTAMTSATCRPVILFEGVFENYTLNLWTGSGDLSWDSKTWQGNGWFAGYQGLVESDDLSDIALEVQLSGLPETVLNLILASVQQGASGKLWVGMTTAALALVSDPVLMFSGVLDYPSLEEGAGDSVVSLKYTTLLTTNQRGREFRFEPETQRLHHPGDTGFDWVTATLEWNGFWGNKRRKPQQGKSPKRTNQKKNKGKS